MKNRRLLLSTSLLGIALLSILLFVLPHMIHASTNPDGSSGLPTVSAVAGESKETSDEAVGKDPFTDPLGDPNSATVSLTDSVMIPGQQDSHNENDPATESAPPILSKDDFFSDALFIGDSRTVGLQDYAELETATFFAYSGLSSFSAFKKKLEVPDVGEVLLEELLTSQHYGKIYLMLGINELGYPLSSICSQYTHVATRIHELHPQTKIILCANLRVVADGKEKRDYVANETINQVNAHIASLADNETFFYVDVNPLFDDGNGALDPQYCADDIHPYGKYYYQWAEWLYTIGIQSLP